MSQNETFVIEQPVEAVEEVPEVRFNRTKEVARQRQKQKSRAVWSRDLCSVMEEFQ